MVKGRRQGKGKERGLEFGEDQWGLWDGYYNRVGLLIEIINGWAGGGREGEEKDWGCRVMRGRGWGLKWKVFWLAGCLKFRITTGT